jgi:methylated-DNA-[protein]-cysteine S-methyltransferase
VGELILGSHGDDLCIADWRYRKIRSAIDIRIQTALKAEYVKQSSSVLQETIRQLDAYFHEGLTEFDIPIQLVGTSFQQKVWSALMQIPYGETETYLGLSKTLGNEKAFLTLATANGANAISVIIPCHRIIGSDGSLVGYAGGLPAKKKLLALENPEREMQLTLL